MAAKSGKGATACGASRNHKHNSDAESITSVISESKFPAMRAAWQFNGPADTIDENDDTCGDSGRGAMFAASTNACSVCHRSDLTQIQ